MAKSKSTPQQPEKQELSIEERELIRKYIVKIGIPSGVALTIISGLIGFLTSTSMNVSVQTQLAERLKQIEEAKIKSDQLLLEIKKSNEEIVVIKSNAVSSKNTVDQKVEELNNALKGSVDYDKVAGLVKEGIKFDEMVQSQVQIGLTEVKDSIKNLRSDISTNQSSIRLLNEFKTTALSVHKSVDILEDSIKNSGTWKKLSVDKKSFKLDKEYLIKIPSYPKGKLASYFHPSVVSEGYLQVSIVHDHSATIEKGDKSTVVSSNLSEINGRAIEIYYRPIKITPN